MWKGNASHRRFGPMKIFFFLLAGALFILSMGIVVMLLWNAILPNLVGVNTIRLWEAVGLLVLSRILFGGFHWNKHRGKWKSRRSQWKDKWMNMSQEERATFKQKWRDRCG